MPGLAFRGIRRWVVWGLAIVVGVPAGVWVGLAVYLSAIESPTFAYRVLTGLDSDVWDYRWLPGIPVHPQPPVFHFAAAPDLALPGKLNGLRIPAAAGPRVIPDFQAFLRDTGTTALLIARDDRLLYEGYFNGYGRDSIQTSFSAAKSVTSLLVGFAIAQGAIGSLDDPLRRYVPELGAEHDALTVRWLLRMASGLRADNPLLFGFVEAPWSDNARIYYTDDLRRTALRVRGEEAPGTRFHYNNFNPLLLGLVLERATGRPVARYLQEQLWSPLGMEFPGFWTVDSADRGFAKMESGLNARAIDFLKLGRLVLRGGDWEGRRLLPAEWIARSTRKPDDGIPLSRALDPWIDPAFASQGGYYAYMWWGYERPGGPPDVFAMGKEGQVLYICPAKGAVLLRHGFRRGTGGHIWWPAVLRSVAERL